MILEGKKVLITGAGRGIGYQTAIDMVKEGAVILGLDLRQEPLDELTAKVEAMGSKAYSATTNIADYEQTKAAIEKLAAEAGGIDVVVNCAAIFEEGYFEELTPEKWHRTVSIDLDGVYNVIHAAIPYLIEAKGNVVAIASQDAFYGCVGYPAYSACKAGVIGLIRTLARELGPKGVRFNCVAPGITETEMTKDRIAAGAAGYLEKLPIGHIGQPEEIAAAILFLASEKASYITGQVLHVNGGMYLG